MKYVILIYSNPASRAMWEGMSDSERAEGYRAHAALAADMAAAGELVTAEALAAPETARTVTLASDGPYAEVKEHLAGFYVVDCASIERAVEWAARIPEAPYVTIEVRPTL